MLQDIYFARILFRRSDSTSPGCALGQIQQQWGKLTNDDLDDIAGNREELIGRIQNTYGIARDEAEKQVVQWEKDKKVF